MNLIAHGDFFALVGPRGSGKSTFMSILGALLRPTAGHMQVASDVEITRLRNQHSGFVFQAHHLLPDFTAPVLHALEGTAFLISTNDPQIAARCDQVINIVDGRIQQ